MESIHGVTFYAWKFTWNGINAPNYNKLHGMEPMQHILCMENYTEWNIWTKLHKIESL